MINAIQLEEACCAICQFVKVAQQHRNGDFEGEETCPAGFPNNGDFVPVMKDGAIWCKAELETKEAKGE